MTTKTYESVAPHDVAFLGLGVMGYPMAGHLARRRPSRHRLQPHREAKAQQWAQEFGGKSAKTPREAAAGAQIVFSCVGNDADLASVMLGDTGALAGMTQGCDRIRQHDRVGKDCARVVRRGTQARSALYRCADFRRPGRRGQWPTDGDVRRRQARVRSCAAGGDGVREGRDTDRRQRRGPARQDGQSDCASPGWCRDCPKASRSARRPGST